jgi:hypothetical protein
MYHLHLTCLLSALRTLVCCPCQSMLLRVNACKELSNNKQCKSMGNRAWAGTPVPCSPTMLHQHVNAV